MGRIGQQQTSSCAFRLCFWCFMSFLFLDLSGSLVGWSRVVNVLGGPAGLGSSGIKGSRKMRTR
ncbi:hypothetical protein C8Q70DRAFT_219355 [Cubamyces menziesii]|nr:hypothetical protein C8Q70DRAFT_219355 [Cubamyces menziesii]